MHCSPQSDVNPQNVLGKIIDGLGKIVAAGTDMNETGRAYPAKAKRCCKGSWFADVRRSSPKMKNAAAAPMIKLSWMPDPRPSSATSPNNAAHSKACIQRRVTSGWNMADSCGRHRPTGRSRSRRRSWPFDGDVAQPVLIFAEHRGDASDGAYLARLSSARPARSL